MKQVFGYVLSPLLSDNIVAVIMCCNGRVKHLVIESPPQDRQNQLVEIRLPGQSNSPHSFQFKRKQFNSYANNPIQKIENTMSEEMAPQLPTPGKEHELLKPFEGTFRAVVKIYTGEDDPYESAGTMRASLHWVDCISNKPIKATPLTAPFLHSQAKASGDTTFKRESTKASGSTMYRRSCNVKTAKVDETGKVWEMTSEVVHPQAGTMVKRSVIRLIDDDHHEVTAYLIPEGDQSSKTWRFRTAGTLPDVFHTCGIIVSVDTLAKFVKITYHLGSQKINDPSGHLSETYR